MPKNISGFILAAGLGTRLKPWTDHHPKALAVVNGKSLLQRNVEYLQKFGITEVVVNVHHFANQIIEAIETNNGWGSKISISDETDMVLETGGGLLKSQKSFGRLRDIRTDELRYFDQFGFKNITSANTKKTKHLLLWPWPNRDTSRYLLFNQNHEMVGWKNIKTEEIKLPAQQKLDSSEPTLNGIQWHTCVIQRPFLTK